MNRLRADFLLLITAAIWGAGFYFQKHAMTFVGPMLFVGLRTAISALVLLPLALREKRSSQLTAQGLLPITALAALAFLMGGGLQQAGLLTASITNASFLTALYVVVVPLVVWLVKKRVPSLRVWSAVGLAFAGSWLLGGGTIGGFTWGDWIITLSILPWAVYIVIVERASLYSRPITFTCLQFFLVTAVALPLAMLFEPLSLPSITAALPSILFVGIFSGALGFTLMTIGLRHVPPSEAAIIMSLEMIFASVAGYVLLNERLTTLGWLGGGLILAAALVVQLRK